MRQSTRDRVAELQAETFRKGIHQRLEKGASILGRLWMNGFRCKGGWKKDCPCPDSTEFCKVKSKWLTLRMEIEPHPMGEMAKTGDETFFILEIMSDLQFEASGITVKVEAPGMPCPLRIGGQGLKRTVLADLQAVPEEERADAWRAVSLIDKHLIPKDQPQAS